MNSALISLAKRRIDFFNAGCDIDYEKTVAFFKLWNQTPDFVVISISKGRLYCHGNGKPDGKIIDRETLKERLNLYLIHFKEIAKLNPNLSTTFILNLPDEIPNINNVPVFGFQKQLDQNALLFPDIDFLCNEYYENEKYTDSNLYESKYNKAVFIGSTTGGGLLNIEGVKKLPPPRIRSALLFKNHEEVVFELPTICQCDCPETVEYIKSLEIGTEFRAWDNQLRYKFILSMDGNGATCSRVVAALMSNSVLCKYDSIHELYYFPLMIPWVHYIPIHEDADVLKVIQMEKKDPGRFREIAKNGSIFAKEYLTRESVIKYTSLLLSEYSRVFPDLNIDKLISAGMPVLSDDWLQENSLQTIIYSDPSSVIENLLGHVSNHGDHVSSDSCTIGIKGSGKPLEGLTITLRDEFKENLAYRVRFQNGKYSDWQTFGSYVGSRLQNLPITDFEIRASDAFHSLYSVYLCLHKTNGSQILKMDRSQDFKIKQEDTAPIEHLVLSIKRKCIDSNEVDHNRIHREIIELSDPVQKLAHLHKSVRILHETLQGEIQEQRLFSQFIAPQMKVLEIGANVGRSTLVIASLLENPRNLVSFECDPASYRRLIDNRDCNGLSCSCVNAAISERKLIQSGWQTIPSETVLPGWNEVPTMTLSEVREKYPLRFDTLVLDCEGAFYHMLKDTPEIMDGITTVIMENDFPELSQKEFVDDAFRSRGLQVKVQKPGPWGPCADRFYEVWKRS